MSPPNRTKPARIGFFALASFCAGSVFAVPPAAPTNFHYLSSNSNNQATLAWNDNSDDETAFIMEVQVGAGWTNPFGSIAANTTDFPITGFTPGAPVTWRLRARNAANEESENVELMMLVLNRAISSTGYHRCEIGDALSFTLSTPGFTDPEFETGDLPVGVTLDADTGVISGMPSEGGFFQIYLRAREGVDERRCSIALVVIDPPKVLVTPTPSGVAGATAEIDMQTVFEDPDTETTAVIKTNLGDIPLTLFDAATTITSDNFKGYMDRGDWDGTIIHRSIPNFIIQGGWLHPEGNKDFSFVESQEQIPDEYDDSRPNAASTIAMARSGPNTASTNWFFSLVDNAQNLDLQDNGFTTFGRALGGGMAVLDVIEAQDTGSYSNVTFDGSGTTMNDLPLTAVTDDSPLDSELVVVNSIERLAPMTFELVSNGDPSVVTASLNDGTLSLEFIGSGSGGESLITVAATDLDGARTEMSFTAVSESSYATWATENGAGAAESNDDGGVLNNLQEYAFGGDPLSAIDDSERSPKFTEVTIGEEGAEETFDAIEFHHHQFSSDLIYTVQMSTNLTTWTDLWTTADGSSDDAIAAAEDQGTYWKLTVRNPINQDEAGERIFYRVLVTLVVEE